MLKRFSPKKKTIETSSGSPSKTTATPAIPWTLDQKIVLFKDSTAKYKELTLRIPFSRQELNRLKKRFAMLLPVGNVLTLPLQQIVHLPELRTGLFTQRVAELVVRPTKPSILEQADGIQSNQDPTTNANNTEPTAAATKDAKGPQSVDSVNNPTKPTHVAESLELIAFDQFLALVTILDVNTSVEIKRQVLFDAYDKNQDGLVSCQEFTSFFFDTNHIPQQNRRAFEQEIGTKFARVKAQPTSPHQSIHTGEDISLTNSEFQQLFSDDEVWQILSIRF